MMKCLKCGIENASDAKYCNNCGEPLNLEQSQELTEITDSNILNRSLISQRFKTLRTLGQGGMGKVILAEDLKLKRNVAIKSILKADLADSNAKIRFLREAQTASQLDHSNICTIYEIYEEQDKDYIVMQYIDGVALDQIIGVKTLSVDKILDIAIQISAGMAEAHSMEVMHRDIKPGNIMIDRKGVVKILDFGLAKFTAEATNKKNASSTNLTERGFVMGTVAYISPEQAKGKPLDKRTDIFSFGIVLYEMIEGVNPFKEDEQIETLYNVLNKEVQFERDIPDSLKQIVTKALAKEKEDRYADFLTIKEDLEAFREQYKTQRKTPPPEYGNETEIIDSREKAIFLEEIQRTSDKEDLGEMVSRIKKFKASTERLHTSFNRTKKFLWVAAPLLLITAALVFLVLFKNGDNNHLPWIDSSEKFYIYLQTFENKTNEDALPLMVDHLIAESLDQFDEFKVINREAALSIIGEDAREVDLALLRNKFNINITLELSGKISKDKGFYTIDAWLARSQQARDQEQTEPRLLTATGEGRDSLLTSQVDLIVRNLYRALFPKQAEQLQMKQISHMYGTHWSEFSNFYAGLTFFKRLDLPKANDFFEKAGSMLMAKYYLADSYYFDGSRKQASALIDEIKPRIRELTPAMQLKVQVLDARITFKFKDEINYLEQLRQQFPFSKEVLYQLGEAHFHKADPRKAIPYYEQAIQLDKNFSKAYNHIGYCYSYIGDHIKANHLFQQYRVLDESANSFDSLGDGYFYSGNLSIAESMKSRAVSPDDKNNRITWPYQTLADIYILKAQYNKAQEALLRYNELEKGNKDTAYVLSRQGFIKYLQGDYSGALQFIDQALSTYHSDDIAESSAEDHWFKGLVLLALNNLQEAKTHLSWLEKFKEKYRLDAENFNAAYKYYLHLKALVAEKENKQEEARQTYQALMSIKDKLSYWITYFNYQYFHTQYVRFLMRNNEYNVALGEIDKCLQFSDIDFPYIPALWAKAQVLEQLNRKDEAKPIYQKISQLYGPDEEENHLRTLLKNKL